MDVNVERTTEHGSATNAEEKELRSQDQLFT